MKATRWMATWVAFVAAPVLADAGWLPAGDAVLRNDLLLLNDARIIRVPVGQWPIPRAAVRDALEDAREYLATNAAVSAALQRVRERVGIRNGLSYQVS